jgi:DNA-binding LacI/PurR family transcriptional regulator
MSVVDSPIELIGERAARRLFRMIEGDAGRGRTNEMPPILIVRESVGQVGRDDDPDRPSDPVDAERD